MSDDDQGKVRRVYGRGYQDGMRAAAKEAGSDMNPSRIESLTQGLNGVAKKVLDVVPKQEPWSMRAIQEALFKTGVNIDVRTVQGCMAHLVDIKIVREPSPGQFVRVVPADKPKPAKEPALTIVSTTPPPAAPPTPTSSLDRLAALGVRARSLATEVAKIAEDIDAVAIGVEEQLQKIERETAKLRQLQDLIRSIGATAA